MRMTDEETRVWSRDRRVGAETDSLPITGSHTLPTISSHEFTLPRVRRNKSYSNSDSNSNSSSSSSSNSRNLLIPTTSSGNSRVAQEDEKSSNNEVGEDKVVVLVVVTMRVQRPWHRGGRDPTVHRASLQTD
uniref:Uncharacterized protein n=1 Tax=Vespula pensylvanica TaxID=30213 RepID=A0A834UCU7_VESPE|nr:hypothetical protein H0235_004296 [Vespula pensylvanica]